VDRALTREERDATSWLLRHATTAGRYAHHQLNDARVCARCACGCGSIDFRISTIRRSDSAAPIQIVSDHWWRTEFGFLCGARVFMIAGTLKGLDVWSIDGKTIPDKLPGPSELWSYDAVTVAGPYERVFPVAKRARHG